MAAAVRTLEMRRNKLPLPLPVPVPVPVPDIATARLACLDNFLFMYSETGHLNIPSEAR